MAETHQTTPATTPAPQSPPINSHVSLLEMIILNETEAERLETWSRNIQDPEAIRWIARRAHIARMTVRTLDLVRDNEKDFVDLIRNKNEVDKRRTKRAK